MPASEPASVRADVRADAELLRPPAGLSLENLDPSGSGDVVLSFPLETRPSALPTLTPAEEAVLGELLLGCSNSEISARRGVTVRTIANQIGGLFRKLGVHSRLEAARVAAGRMSQKRTTWCAGGRPFGS